MLNPPGLKQPQEAPVPPVMKPPPTSLVTATHLPLADTRCFDKSRRHSSRQTCRPSTGTRRGPRHRRFLRLPKRLAAISACRLAVSTLPSSLCARFSARGHLLAWRHTSLPRRLPPRARLWLRFVLRGRQGAGGRIRWLSSRLFARVLFSHVLPVSRVESAVCLKRTWKKSNLLIVVERQASA